MDGDVFVQPSFDKKSLLQPAFRPRPAAECCSCTDRSDGMVTALVRSAIAGLAVAMFARAALTTAMPHAASPKLLLLAALLASFVALLLAMLAPIVAAQPSIARAAALGNEWTHMVASALVPAAIAPTAPAPAALAAPAAPAAPGGAPSGLEMRRDPRANWSCDAAALAASLPMDGTCIPFETSLFKGFLVQRVRRGGGDGGGTDAAWYWRGRRRRAQSLVVGVFKERVRVDAVLTGQEFSAPFRKIPNWIRTAVALAKRISPGMRADLLSNTPSMLAPLAATAQTMRVDDAAGFTRSTVETLAAARDIDEDTTRLLSAVMSAQRRRAYFSDRVKAARHWFEPGVLGKSGSVYTFDCYQDKLDLTEWALPLRKPASWLIGDRIDLSTFIGSQPIRILARVERAAGDDDALLWSFDLVNMKASAAAAAKAAVTGSKVRAHLS